MLSGYGARAPNPNGTYLRDVVPIDIQFATETHGKTRNIH
jgi:hypothetical protein